MTAAAWTARHSRTAPRRWSLEWLAKRANLGSARALQSVTMVNAEVLGRAGDIGSIEKGKYADLIAVSSDPQDHPQRPAAAHVSITVAAFSCEGIPTHAAIPSS
jgi:imidazolonepropionase-like amidohydrolase